MYKPHASWPIGGAAAAPSAALHTAAADSAGAAALAGGDGCASGNSSSTRCMSAGIGMLVNDMSSAILSAPFLVPMEAPGTHFAPKAKHIIQLFMHNCSRWRSYHLQI